MLGKNFLKAGVIFLLLFSLWNSYSKLADSRVFINESVLKAEIASTPRQRERGLSGRESIASDEAMIFKFEEEDFHSMWMKDMNFPIDIIWISKDKVIVDFEKNVPPESYPEIFTSESPAKYVLEVKAGFIKENELKKGDGIEFDL